MREAELSAGVVRPLPLVWADQTIGRIHPANQAAIARHSDLFNVTNAAVEIQASNDLAHRFDAFADDLVAAGDLQKRFIRDERYPVKNQWNAPTLFTIERGLAGYLGLKCFSVHLCAWTVDAFGATRPWVAVRSKNKDVNPGAWDNLVGGGQPADLGLRNNLIKECWEEAGLSRTLAEKAGFAEMITIQYDQPNGYYDCDTYCYDLALAEDFVPDNQDGEVERFFTLSFEEFQRHVFAEASPFTADVRIVNQHWLMRYSNSMSGANNEA